MTQPARRNESIRLHGTIRLSADGLAKVLGELEAAVMTTVWRVGHPAPARRIYALIREERELAIHTVITVLNKLVKKGLLKRDKVDDLLHYEALVNEESFRLQVSRQVVEGILALGPDAVTSSIVDVLADQDPARLRELGRLIERRLAEGRELDDK